VTRVFVYEHLCARQADSGLSVEGRAMLLAALADLCALEDVAASTLIHPSLLSRLAPLPSLPRLTVHEASDEEKACFLRAARGCDFALVIAPEFDDILARRCEWALEAGCRLLGPSPEAVRLCADKLRLAEYLGRCGGLLAPATSLYDPQRPPTDGYPYVVKPRSGAGAQATFVVNSALEFGQVGGFAQAQGFGGELIVQPFCRGQAGSVAVIADASHPHRPRFLPPAEQLIETTSPSGQLRYAGGSVEYPIEWRYPCILAQCVAVCLPGTSGYFGIDFVFDRGGFTDNYVIEINPRLTTSYVGLRRLSNVNLMRVLLDVVRGVEPPPLSWRDARVCFSPDGSVHED
jgi:predicted ATP-grasp superfamily ATP-dependent carboligase